jgi:hypothetical protein
VRALASILSDPDWQQVESDEFEAKFLKHDMPIVRKLASDYKEMVDAEQQQCASQEEEIGRQQEAKEPAKEVDPFQNLSEAAASNYWHWFNVFSSSDRTTWDSRNQILSHNAPTNSKYDGDFAACSIPLPANKVSSWDVKVDVVNNNLVLGILNTGALFDANKKKVSSSYRVEQSSGWGMTSKVYANNMETSDGDWPGWQVGDRGKFTYDPATNKLSLYLERTQKTYSMNTNPEQRAHLHCFMKGNAKVDFTTD